MDEEGGEKPKKEPITEPHYFLFDMDNTLVNSGDISMEVWLRTFRDLQPTFDSEMKKFLPEGKTRDLGYKLEDYKKIKGIPVRKAVEKVVKEKISDVEKALEEEGDKEKLLEFHKAVDKVTARGRELREENKRNHYKLAEQPSNIPLLQGAREMLDDLYLRKKRGEPIKIALVTVSNDESVKKVLDLHNLNDYFDLKVTRNTVEGLGYEGAEKDVYYKHAMDKLGAKPEQCTVFEDSMTGLKGASGAQAADIMYMPTSDDQLTDTIKIFDNLKKLRDPDVPEKEKLELVEKLGFRTIKGETPEAILKNLEAKKIDPNRVWISRQMYTPDQLMKARQMGEPKEKGKQVQLEVGEEEPIAEVNTVAYPAKPLAFLAGRNPEKAEFEGMELRGTPPHPVVGITVTSMDGKVKTETNVKVERAGKPGVTFKVNKEVLTGDKAAGMMAIVSEMLRKADEPNVHITISSVNHPEIKSGTSASGAAALIEGVNRALGLNLTTDEKAKLATMASGSAHRSIVGGVSALTLKPDLHVEQLVGSDKLNEDYNIYTLHFSLPEGEKRPTGNEVHRAMNEHKKFKKRQKNASKRVKEMKEHIQKGDLDKMFEIAERDVDEANEMLKEQGIDIRKGDMENMCSFIRSMRQGKDKLRAWYTHGGGKELTIIAHKDDAEKVRGRLETIGMKPKEYKFARGVHLVG